MKEDRRYISQCFLCNKRKSQNLGSLQQYFSCSWVCILARVQSVQLQSAGLASRLRFQFRSSPHVFSFSLNQQLSKPCPFHGGLQRLEKQARLHKYIEISFPLTSVKILDPKQVTGPCSTSVGQENILPLL